MGGHGGLNILPQKRWHLYREDNQARVLRDEREHREALIAKKEKLENKRFNDQITILSRKASIANKSLSPLSTTSNILNPEKNEILNKAIDSHEEKNQHINFFEKEETALLKRESDHLRYLKSVAHKFNSKSEFTQCMELSPWYSKPKEKHSFISNDENLNEISQNFSTDKETNLIGNNITNERKITVAIKDPHSHHIKKEKKKLKHRISKNDNKNINKHSSKNKKIEILRQERNKREEKERTKSNILMNQFSQIK